MQSKAQNLTRRTSQPNWYQAYFVALQERDRDKALLEIERARRAIEQRTFELSQVPGSNARELQDLGHALTYLGILLMHIGRESGDVLWD